MTTYYDILGVVPAIEPDDLARSYKESVLAELEEKGYGPERFVHATSMWRSPRLDRITELTAAYKAINSSDRREAYNRRLMKEALICPVCEGRGKTKPDSFKSIPCAACKGTGKGIGSYE